MPSRRSKRSDPCELRSVCYRRPSFDVHPLHAADLHHQMQVMQYNYFLQQAAYNRFLPAQRHPCDFVLDLGSPPTQAELASTSYLPIPLPTYQRLVHSCSGGRRAFYEVSSRGFEQPSGAALMTEELALLGKKTNGPVAAADDTSLINRKLHHELLLKIFSHLDIVSLCRCAQTCKLWNVCALDGSNWQTVDFFQFQRDIKGQVVESLAKRCGGFLKELSLYGCENVQDGALKTFSEKCNCIEKLNLRKCKRLTDLTCKSLSIHCPRLSSLNLECCSEITDFSLKSLSEGCQVLQVLNISWCDRITDNGILALANGCRHLRTVLLKGLVLVRFITHEITDESLKALAQCNDLRVVNLYKCPVHDEGMQELAYGCNRLEHLCLSRCAGLTDRTLVALSHGCHMLRYLELAGCSQITDASFAALTKVLQTCHDLEKIDLEECNLITDATLNYLATGCPNITNLSLSHCEQISDEGIRQLSQSLAVNECLTELALDNCPLVTDASLEHLRDCRTLQRIDLYDCQQISRSGIRRFKSYLPHVIVHAYFAPNTPPMAQGRPSRRYCRCCNIL